MDTIIEQQCLLCGKPTKLMTSKQKGYQEPQIYSIYHCPNCNTSFSIPRVDANQVYELIYKKGSKVIGYDRYWKYAEEIMCQKDPFNWLANTEPAYWGPYNAIIEELKVDKKAEILEVGSGLGYFTYALRKAGFHQATGWDISSEAVNNAKNRFGDYYKCCDLLEESENYLDTFDVIVLTEVIEHIEKPQLFLSLMLKMLKKGGNIILTTPNKSFYPNNAIWNSDLPPVHCWWFSENTFEYLSTQMKFALQFINYSSFYKTHLPSLFNVKDCGHLSNTYVFDKEGEIIINLKQIHNNGIFPLWMKKTKMYKNLSCRVYPLLSKCFFVSGERTDTLCAIITK